MDAKVFELDGGEGEDVAEVLFVIASGVWQFCECLFEIFLVRCVLRT